MINQKILDKIFIKSMNNEFINKAIIREIIADLMLNQDNITKSNLKVITFDRVKKYDDALATFNEFTNEMTVDLKGMYENELMNESSSMLEKNLNIIRNVLHELEHVKEKYKMRGKGIESEILKCSSCNIIYNKYFSLNSRKYDKHRVVKEKTDKMYKQFYESNFHIIPSERIADANSTKLLIDSLLSYDDFNIVYKNIIDNLYEMYFEFLALGYKKEDKNGHINVPLIDYLNKVRSEYLPKYNFTHKRLKDESKKLQIEERLKFGLPVTPYIMNEFIKIQEKVLK